jgi:hypothetical protein
MTIVDYEAVVTADFSLFASVLLVLVTVVSVFVDVVVAVAVVVVVVVVFVVVLFLPLSRSAPADGLSRVWAGAVARRQPAHGR